MNTSDSSDRQREKRAGTPAWLIPLQILAWPFVFVGRLLYRNWISYLIGAVRRDAQRVYSVRFIWYGESVYLHPMIWGSLVLYFVAKSEVFAPGWPLLVWFVLLLLCFLTVMYNFDIFKAGVLLVSLIAVFGIAYISTSEWHWNPLRGIDDHIRGLHASVTPGFYVISCYAFVILIAAEVIWAWLFNRVELDESYVYEHRFMKSTTREPIFARGLKRETKDLLELLILGAGDIQHRTKTGYKRFTNVPGASLGLGKAIDQMLDYRSAAEFGSGRKGQDDDEQSLIEHAMPDAFEEQDDDAIHDE
ncbi:MAG: hypothetical protein MUF48_05730 [Pirellulaceae bacterium]|jgi:hypothetical protein|nr:hypothetical protein [Pirellulaceae bacterium]